ncbi:epoxide hydrolase [Flavobacterium plurextorum]|uniref:epoxide hydrolase family protein n=1 Tax=Flavobacterium TaxID=237 RepID=UPI00214D542B|nr:MULTISPECIES: epoxide hydrolase family protein [Flavobacterium]UUW08773.1 epoxide hydrolase [Flavobacterium plurextorum]
MDNLTRRQVIKTGGLALIAIAVPFFTKANKLIMKKKKKDNMRIKPFKVNIPQDILDDLNARLDMTRWPDEINESHWTYGTDLSYMKELTNYWQNKFDWRKIENEINSYPNFIADIDGMQIHYIHVKGKSKKSIPLIMTHGWPGSFLEMMKIMPMLTENPDWSFDLVIPSIPGFGFSSKVNKEGCNSEFVADIWQKLMINLGYEKFGVQGGDIGSGISSWLSLKYPSNIIGLHLNYISGSYKPYLKDGEILSDEMIEFKKNSSEWSSKYGAYAYLHSTKPLTAAYGLNDSPAGLCAWIIEKFNDWSDNDGNIENTFTKDELLSNVTLYWVTQTIHSSMRIYNENSKKPLAFKRNEFIGVPVGFAHFPKELPTPPRAYIEKSFNITHWTDMKAGGHFAAAEQPELLSKDIIDFFSHLKLQDY